MLMESRLFRTERTNGDTAAARQGVAASDGAGRLVGQGVGFERIRRITGYLVGTLERFNNAKRAEEADRVRHA